MACSRMAAASPAGDSLGTRTSSWSSASRWLCQHASSFLMFVAAGLRQAVGNDEFILAVGNQLLASAAGCRFWAEAFASGSERLREPSVQRPQARAPRALRLGSCGAHPRNLSLSVK